MLSPYICICQDHCDSLERQRRESLIQVFPSSKMRLKGGGLGVAANRDLGAPCELDCLFIKNAEGKGC